MISKDKTYTTKCGFDVRIYATDGRGDWPIHGAYRDEDGWHVHGWEASGESVSSRLDLIEAPVTRQMWANVHDDQPSVLWLTKENADQFATATRIACVPVTITYRPGEGL